MSLIGQIPLGSFFRIGPGFVVFPKDWVESTENDNLANCAGKTLTQSKLQNIPTLE